MLLRWLVNQYLSNPALRDAAQERLREVVSEALVDREPGTPSADAGQISSGAPRNATEGVPYRTDDDAYLPCDVAFIFALGIESGGLVDCLKGDETSRHKHGVERAGKLDGREVVIVESGVGSAAAARATKATIEFYRPQWVVSAGFAGALHEDLRRGHVLMADTVARESGEQLAVGIKLEPHVLAATKGLHVGRLVTVDRLIRHPAERRALANQTGAFACDMETYAVAQACRDAGTRLLSVRIISDAVNDELPREIEHLLSQKSLAGKIGAAAGAVMHRFSAAKDLWNLREDALKASDRLAKFLRGVVGQLGP
jgi:adenosylhomocysteine nucleosidase